MGRIFITSDTFFGREQIIKKAKRPFDSVEEMDARLIENWNNAVSEEDTVYHLGNFAWNPLVAEKVLSELNGEIIFMLGEYDDALIETLTYFDHITILDGQIHEDKDLKAILCHWPLERWKGKSRGVYHYHGSTLKSMKTDMKKMNRVNVCCDNWNYTPQSVEDLHSLFEDWKKEQKKAK
jgi:calcineurin-like phosphoesterase family protein